MPHTSTLSDASTIHNFISTTLDILSKGVGMNLIYGN